jgi:hypothetical protein
LDKLNKNIIKRNKEIDRLIEAGNLAPRDKKELRLEKRRPVTSVVLCREISKMHETTYRGDLSYIIEQIKKNQDEQRGEFVVIIGK